MYHDLSLCKTSLNDYSMAGNVEICHYNRVNKFKLINFENCI